MKGLFFGAAAAVALSFGFAGAATAGDLVAKCKANAEAEGADVVAMEGFCGCLVEQAGDNTALIDELMVFAEVAAEERSEKFEAEGSEAAKAAVAACTPEETAATPAQ